MEKSNLHFFLTLILSLHFLVMHSVRSEGTENDLAPNPPPPDELHKGDPEIPDESKGAPEPSKPIREPPPIPDNPTIPIVVDDKGPPEPSKPIREPPPIPDNPTIPIVVDDKGPPTENNGDTGGSHNGGSENSYRPKPAEGGPHCHHGYVYSRFQGRCVAFRKMASSGTNLG